MVMKMTYVGKDSLFRPVYRDDRGRFWKDTDPRAHVPASLYEARSYEGKPEIPFRGKPRFIPKRVTW